MPFSRRDFCRTAAALAASLGVSRWSQAAKAVERADPSAVDKMPSRPFGKTGRTVSIYALGSAEMPGGDANVKTLHALIDAGVSYFDTAPSYMGTRSESTIGEVMKTRRKEVFLATKTLDRTAEGAYREVQASLGRLQTDHVDLLQIHAVNDFGTLDAVLAKGGAIEGLERAKKDGLIKHIGITGHTRPEVTLKAIESYGFDSILVALSALDKSIHDFADEVLPKAKKLGIGVVGMKALKGIERSGKTFESERFLRYVWSLPVSTLTIGLRDLKEAEQNIVAANRFKPMNAAEMKALETEVAALANDSTLWWKRR